MVEAMAPDLDPRDAEMAATAAAVIAGLVLAIEANDNREIGAQMTKLLHAVIAYHATLGERPQDEALRQAVARLGCRR
jgi:hypothetical protein